jgi:hypothetical protein
MSTGIPQDDISLEETIKLYVNHRPVHSLNSNEIEAAFEIISQRYSPRPLVLPSADIYEIGSTQTQAIDQVCVGRISRIS